MRKHPSLLAAVPVAVLLCAFGAGLVLSIPGSSPAAPGGLAPSAPLPGSARSWSLRKTPVVKVVQRVRDAVVNIHSERSARGPAAEELFSLAPSQNRINGMGTGVIIDPRGYIITNQHVVEEVSSIRVRLSDGTTTRASVVARDHDDDLALLKISLSRKLPTMPLGSARDLMVGETVIAVGNAYGYEHTVSVGVVSATGRDVTLNKEISYRSLIQTDAAINPGNSGGPLINLDGELVGVNVAIRAGAQGIGFAIPVDTMIEVASEMFRKHLNAGLQTGIQVEDRVATLPDQPGWTRRVVIDQVTSQELAKADVRVGDELLRIGKVDVKNSFDVQRALLNRQPGEKLAIEVKRGAQQRGLDVTLAGRRRPPVDQTWRRLGVRLQTVSADYIARQNPQLNGGLIVMDVQANGAASRAGIQRGDVLVGLHQWEMLTDKNINYVLNHPELRTFLPLKFFIVRSGQVHRGWLTPTE